MSQHPLIPANAEIIFVVEETPESTYIARALGHSIYTEADTLPELRAMVRDAVLCHFNENEKPTLIRLHFVKQELIAV
ncbi:MAG TPA: hypothetical protein PK239_03540 [Chitinophagales bacterium]|nr:hypothetical protein [Chitinophagales bacterium]HRK26344.1 hypothetical protein [Chitinophagales bacterium]